MNDQPTRSEGGQRAPSWPVLLFGRRARIIWTISLGVAIQAFGWFLVSTIMPSVVLELGSPHLLSWGTTAFLALSVPGSASAGYLKGRFGARNVLVAAGIIVIASNLLGLASPTLEVFLLSRAIQGLGEGLVLALCYILVGDSLQPREISPAFALVAVVPLEPGAAALRLGASAVLETRDGVLSYWALAHPAARPDFHAAGGFTLRLDPC